MMDNKSLEVWTGNARTVEVWTVKGLKTVKLEVTAPDTERSAVATLTYAQAHEIADWIKANVPEPEKTPPPTKFAAVVKTTDGKLYTRADASGEGYEYDWVRAGSNGGDWEPDSYLIAAGFEVIFEGVDL